MRSSSLKDGQQPTTRRLAVLASPSDFAVAQRLCPPQYVGYRIRRGDRKWWRSTPFGPSLMFVGPSFMCAPSKMAAHVERVLKKREPEEEDDEDLKDLIPLAIANDSPRFEGLRSAQLLCPPRYTGYRIRRGDREWWRRTPFAPSLIFLDTTAMCVPGKMVRHVERVMKQRDPKWRPDLPLLQQPIVAPGNGGGGGAAAPVVPPTQLQDPDLFPDPLSIRPHFGVRAVVLLTSPLDSSRQFKATARGRFASHPTGRRSLSWILRLRSRSQPQ